MKILYNIFMTQQFYIKGMHCDGCQRKLTRALSAIPGVAAVSINLDSGKTIAETNAEVNMETFAETIKQTGPRYSLELQGPSFWTIAKKKLTTFRPLIIAFVIITLWTVIQQSISGLDLHNAMHDIMGAFFLIFGGLKVANWKGFAESYRGYDALAKVSKLYAYAYPAIEVYLGISYEARFFSFPFKTILFPEVIANIVTVIILGIATIGILKVLREKQQVQCACLGGFFSIPITWVTVAENVLMIAMAIFMQIVYGKI